jgi:hypothetical protein
MSRNKCRSGWLLQLGLRLTMLRQFSHFFPFLEKHQQLRHSADDGACNSAGASKKGSYEHGDRDYIARAVFRDHYKHRSDEKTGGSARKGTKQCTSHKAPNHSIEEEPCSHALSGNQGLKCRSRRVGRYTRGSDLR